MRATLMLTPAGVLVLTEDGRSEHFSLSGDVGETFARLRSPGATGWLKELVEGLKARGFESLATPDPLLHEAIRALGHGCQLLSHYQLPRDRVELVLSAGVFPTVELYEQRLREVAIRVTELMIKEAVLRRDQMIVQAMRTLDEVQETLNSMYSRLVDWYGIHFPELKDIVGDPERYVRVVLALGPRSNVSREAASDVLDRKEVERLVEASRRSLGIEVSDVDMAEILELAKTTYYLIEYRDRLQNYVRQLMAVEAPNVSAIAGPMVGARLITLAGGLDRLARAPASLVQLLGAEKALFRFLRTGRGAPKHGVIFQHPYVHGSPKWQRGKMARALAAKIAIAARIDYFSGEDRSAMLREELERRVKEIREKYATPPVKERVEVRRPPRPPGGVRRQRRRR
ncbi:MAG: hypothetical protein NZ988_05840 [Thaumarchaeota archaeon]|nr:hypothetical protein [Candidatus Calditenuaceae archaeon]MDW8187544.1 hypothetical protein [Nitrososphaerota archaeon]